MDHDLGTNPLHTQNSAMSKLEKAGKIVGAESLRDQELTGLATLARTLKDENIRLSKQLLTYKRKEGMTDLKSRKQVRAATPRQKKLFEQTGEKVTKRKGGGEAKEMEMSSLVNNSAGSSAGPAGITASTDTGSMLQHSGYKPESFRLDDDSVGGTMGGAEDVVAALTGGAGGRAVAPNVEGKAEDAKKSRGSFFSKLGGTVAHNPLQKIMQSGSASSRRVNRPQIDGRNMTAQEVHDERNMSTEELHLML